jgi:DnaJ-domain-containing protein 1
MQNEFPDLNSLLSDFAVYFQWLDLGRQLASMGYPIGHLLTGERPRGQQNSSNNGQGSSGTSAYNEALSVLGLSGDVTQEEIKQAYRRMTKKFHPDVHATASIDIQELAEEKMRKVNEAYEILTS